jgi:hypothetical protein
MTVIKYCTFPHQSPYPDTSDQDRFLCSASAGSRSPVHAGGVEGEKGGNWGEEEGTGEMMLPKLLALTPWTSPFLSAGSPADLRFAEPPTSDSCDAHTPHEHHIQHDRPSPHTHAHKIKTAASNHREIRSSARMLSDDKGLRKFKA